MKIVYLHQYFNTVDVKGGTRSYEFASRLVRDGHDVHLITSSRAGGAESSTWQTNDIDGIVVHSIPQAYNNAMSPKQRLLAFLRFAYKASLRARALRGDVVFATSTPLTIAIPGVFATIGRRTLLVMEIRDLWPDVPIAMGYLRNPIARLSARVLERVAYRRAAKIVALSSDMAAGIRAKGVDASRVTVIPNLSVTERFQADCINPDRFYEEHPELGGRDFVVYTGAFGHVNGVEYMASLANAYGQHDPDMAFVAIGDGARKEIVRKIASDLGVLDKNFFIFDPIPKKELPTVLAAATACSSWVIPVKELAANSANKFFDGLAAGRPVLINYDGWQGQVLTSSGAGLVLSATNVDEAAEVLHQHLRDPVWLSEAREASDRLGRTEYEVEHSYAKLRSILESV